MTNVLDAIEEEERRGQQVKCKTCIWLAARPPEEREQWESALTDTTRETVPIHRAMARFGFEGSISSLRAHRSDHKER